MSLKASKAVSNIPPLEAGGYPARVLSIIDLGRQAQTPWQGKERPPVHKIMLTYEFLDEFLPDENGEDDVEKPRVISERFPLHPITSSRATSTKRYLVLDPENIYDGDWSMLLNVPVVLTVVQNPTPDRIYNNVGGIAPMRPKDATRASELVNPSFVFDLDNPDMKVWENLHDWIKDLIKANLDYAGSPLQVALDGGPAYTQEATEDEPW